MNREQITRDFSQLYIGQNSKRLTEEYYRKKKKEIFILTIAAIFIVVLCTLLDHQNSDVENNIIFRGETGEAKEEILLQIKTDEEKWKDISLELYPKEYSEEELYAMFDRACQYLPELILKENIDLDQIGSDLNLVQDIEGFPFYINWKSSNEEIIDSNGKILFREKLIDEEVSLTAYFSYETWEEEYVLPVHVRAQKSEDLITSLKDNLKEKERLTREKKEFDLPEEFGDQVIQWRYPPGNSSVVLGIFFLFMLPFISYQKDRELHKQTQKRKEQLQESFPDFISKLILLMEAGMSIRGAFFRIGEDYQKKRQWKKNYLYEEVLYICRQMKNGLTEKEGYELLGKRCGLASYKKLSGLLVQHLQKGGSNVLDTLREESVKVCEEQKRNVQKKGEEMGTKLLFPMILMLGIVMIFIMVPALFSFQM